MRRSFLALQGTASPFFNQLATALVERGHRVHRVNFCGGDLAYAGRENVSNFSAEAHALPDWYSEIFGSGDFTDTLLFGDCRKIHQPVHATAEQNNIRVNVFEEGYVRPHWLTMELHGVNGRSRLPRDPAWYREQRTMTPPSPTGQTTGYNLYERAYHDIRYRAANAIYASRFPHYESHRPHNGYREYAGLARRLLLERQYRAEAKRLTERLLAKKLPYYLFPLQLNSDSQIQVHSPFDSIRQAIDHVLTSFAAHAPADALLVIKNHPLDTGLIEYRNYAKSAAKTLGVADRLEFIDAGHLPTLLDRARGVVVVNSTVGLSALHHRRPLKALGTAIYDLEGMTWHGSLDTFWREAEEPDMTLYQAFLDYLVHHTQINGDFYTRTGIAMAVAGVVKRLEATTHD
ncbi:capsule biosynthesis protein [Ralstonia sp. SET104]|uniref:capsule biosynthesis protein n=1 Tax=Ralstonia sp. SET104 TaxID=2448774 RepID=UPI000F5765E6|nr:capsular biosynthesis protein [Ralstonia sp. SET104]